MLTTFRTSMTRSETARCSSNNGATTTNTYNAGNELITSQSSAGVTTSTYDADGNLLTSVAPGNQWTTNTWDGENRLTKVALPSGIVDSFILQWRRSTRPEAGFDRHDQPSLGRAEHFARDQRRQCYSGRLYA